MKPKNFPARKLLRKINAEKDISIPYTKEETGALKSARFIRTKKNRGSLYQV